MPLIRLIILGWELRVCLKCLEVASVTFLKKRMIPDARVGWRRDRARPRDQPHSQEQRRPRDLFCNFKSDAKKGGGLEVHVTLFVIKISLLLSRLIRPNVINSKLFML